MSGTVGVIAKTDPLIADSLPKEFGALNRNRVARQQNDAVNMDIGIGKITGESGIVVLNHRTQQQRSFALEPEFVPGQKAGVVEIEPFGSGADDANVAIIVEDRESIAIFQGPQRPLDERPLDFDIVPGQLYRRVRDAFYTARRRMSVVADVRSPRKLRFAAIQPRGKAPALRVPGVRRFWMPLGFIASARQVQDRRAALLRKPLPSLWRDLARGHERHGNLRNFGGFRNARQERTIGRDIGPRHPRRGESLFKFGANLAPVHVSDLLHSLHRRRRSS